ncbi:MAG: hypothetical protein NT154_42325 [Verrucomicrobia bacterium]|nr:hypothetical protein [Verrucomicrobiota bacterium]
MRPGARFVLIEFKEGKLPEGPPEAVKIPRKRLIELITQAGLMLESEQADLLPYQVFLVFRKGGRTATKLKTVYSMSGMPPYPDWHDA